MKGSLSAPGFRFHPTDEELVLYYLKRKICHKRIIVDAIGETDVYKWNPEELPGLAVLNTGDRQWFFFTPRGRKYPNGARSSRGTATGYWKATGKDRIIMYNSRPVGVKKTLVFYKGRAPSGERTDWVMHEYTLDEEELNRCQNAKDYYALYKLFKKSGAGPKNGEQYGAPFREEDWVDDDDQYATKSADSEVPSNQHTAANHADDVIANGTVGFPLDDLEDFFEGIEEPALPPLLIEGVAHVVPQVVAEEEKQSIFVPTSSSEFVIPASFEVLEPIDQQFSGHDSFDLTQTLISEERPNELSEVTSASKFGEPAPIIFEEGFIEIDDLMNEETPVPASEHVQNQNVDEFFDSSEFDLLFHDVAMSLEDPFPFGQETVQPLGNTTQMQLYSGYRVQQQTGENQHVDSNLLKSDQINDGFWAEDYIFAQSQSNCGDTSSPASGVTHKSTIPPAGVCSRDQEGKDAGCSGSRFSSALWSFMDSIPHNPASAAEGGPLVNRVFVRMSSFNRIRLTKNSNTSVSTNAAAIKRSGRNRGFLLISVLGVLCAAFWFILGSIRIPGKSIFS